MKRNPVTIKKLTTCVIIGFCSGTTNFIQVLKFIKSSGSANFGNFFKNHSLQISCMDSKVWQGPPIKDVSLVSIYYNATINLYNSLITSCSLFWTI